MYHPRFKGKHYDIGFKFGNLLKKNKIDLFGLSELDDFQFNYGCRSESIVIKYFPEVCEEIRGMADGIGIPYQRFSAWLMCISVCLEVPGCSMFAIKKNGKVIFGRNNDLPPMFRKLSTSALYSPYNGYSFIANSSAFICAEEGINEKGLAVGMTYVWAKELHPGFSSMFLVRYILEKCATVDEGLNLIQHVSIGGAYHLLLADKREILHVECSPQKIKTRKDKIAAATNHFTSEEMKNFEDIKNLYYSYERYETGYNSLVKISNEDEVDQIKNILSGNYGFMCQYNKEINFDTVWSSVFDTTNGTIYRAEGNPSRIMYKEDVRLNQRSRLQG